MLRYFCARTFRRGLLLLHHTIFGQVMQLFSLKITGEHGIVRHVFYCCCNQNRLGEYFTV